MAQIGSPVVFTSTEAVRGALGIDQTDIADQSILNAALDVELGLDLYTWCPDYGAKLTVDPDSATPEQLLMKAALTTYAKWFCAAEFARKPLAHLQLYGDGKAEQRRFTNFEWDQLVAYCAGKAAHYKAMAMELDPATADQPGASYATISRGVPTYDPVTNEGAV